jgi:hypothetical protein
MAWSHHLRADKLRVKLGLPKARRTRRPQAPRPSVELLEDRTVPSSSVVGHHVPLSAPEMLAHKLHAGDADVGRHAPHKALSAPETLADELHAGDADKTADAALVKAMLGGARALGPMTVALPLTMTDTPGATVEMGSGSKLTDSAKLTGGVSPTGDLTFTLYGPDGTVVDTETVPSISGDGSYTTPAGFVPLGAGTYEWVVAYSGDKYNPPITSVKGAGPEVVSLAGPTVATNSGGNAAFTGAVLTDTATLSGGDHPTGTITFTLMGPTGAGVCSQTIAVTGDGVYTTPTGFMPTKTGTYQWDVHYSGDRNNAGGSDMNNRKGQVQVTPPPLSTISGTAYADRTGNGFSSDDTPTSGAVIYLYKRLSDVGTGQDYLAKTTTDSNGRYTFSVPAGKYYVQETVPYGYVQTGGGPDSRQGTYYAITSRAGLSYPNNNFDTYQSPTGTITDVSYTVTTPSGTHRTVTYLGGNAQPGDTVTATFTVPTGGPTEQITLVSYTATGPSFTSGNAAQQRIFDEATGFFAPGKTYSITVQIPLGFFQIDFVHGAAISMFIPDSAGPNQWNITYHGQHRFIDGNNGGATPTVTPDVHANDFGTAGFWNTGTGGQTLIDQLNGGGHSTALGDWLAANFQHLFGSLADGTNTPEKNLAGLTDSQVGAYFQTLYSANRDYAQIMAAALAAYATDTSLAGGTFAKTFNFNTSTDGTGLDSWDVGSTGSVLGVANNSSQTILNILHGVDQLASSSAQLKTNLAALNALFTGINAKGGIS